VDEQFLLWPIGMDLEMPHLVEVEATVEKVTSMMDGLK
jgi:hypothetical protein